MIIGTSRRKCFSWVLATLVATLIYWYTQLLQRDFALEHQSAMHTNNKGRVPDVIGIGIKMCGTEVYINFLKEHGMLRTPTWHNFETEYFTTNTERGLEWYKSLFDRTPDEKVVIEMTSHYFYAAPESIPQDMLRTNPNVKIILVICEPAARAYSCFVHRRQSERDWPGKFENYLKQQLPMLQRDLKSLPDVRQQQIYLLQNWKTPMECLLAGLYSVHIERWTKVFDKSQLLIVDGEKMLTHPGQVYTKMQDFIGIPRRIREEDWVRHGSTGHFCLRRPSNRTDIYCQDSRRDKARTQTNLSPKPKESVMEYLRQFYEPYNIALYQILHQDFGW